MTTLTINKELNGIEITFGSKPAQKVIDSLKTNGFFWHKAKKLWYAKNTAERLAFAKSIADEKTEVIEKVKKISELPSLWERCKTDNIPEHDRTADTKTVAAETRKQIKERFPEIKFSCRIGSGGWAATNEVNFCFKSAPFAKDSIYFEAVKKYVEAWLWSFNYDNSDSMTDYFDRNFYEFIRADYDFEETKPTEAQKADLANFDVENQKAKEEEQRQREEEYKKYLAEQEERGKAYKERRKIEETQKVEINNHVKVVDIAENEKYIVSGSMICGHGKECNITELQSEGTEKEESALVKRELYFTDEEIYNNFCNMFLHDFDFLDGFGGTGTLDNVKWILWDCVAVFLNNELKLIIDPEDFNYARYANIVSKEYTKIMLNDETQQKERKENIETTEITEDAKEETQETIAEVKEEIETSVEETPEERTYYSINEETARIAKEINSFSDYEKGSATAEYRRYCDKAYDILDKIRTEKPEQAEHAGKKVDYYCRKLAEYYNDYYRNEASCPSVLICGAGNFPVKKKNRQNSRRETLHNTWEYLENYLRKIEDILTNKQPIKSGDSDAIEKLTAKIEQLEKEHRIHLEANRHYKKNGTLKGFNGLEEKEVTKIEDFIKRNPVFPPFITYNETANIRRYKERLAELIKEKESENIENVETDNKNNELFTVVENKEIMRLQILFDGVPEAPAREILKNNGFKWSPKNKAWQRQLTDNARYTYKNIKDNLKDALMA